MLNRAKTAVKAVLEKVHRHRRAKQLEHLERHVTCAELTADLVSLGIKPGDALFIHSSLKSLGYVEGGAPEVIRALQAAVGPEGTLVMPGYYMPGGTILATCKLEGYVFDVRKHGTNMGRLPEAFLETPGVHRSVHPTHSILAWGRHARYITEAHHRAPSTFGVGSPWQRFLEIEAAEFLGLGVSMAPITVYHAVEDDMGDSFPLPVWEGTTYHLPCLDAEGKTWQVPVRPFDPALAARRIDHAPREDLREYFRMEFERIGMRVNGRVGNAEAWLVPAQAFFEHLKELAREGITIYSTAEELAARPLR